MQIALPSLNPTHETDRVKPPYQTPAHRSLIAVMAVPFSAASTPEFGGAQRTGTYFGVTITHFLPPAFSWLLSEIRIQPQSKRP